MQFRFVFPVRVFSHWFVKQSFDCFIHEVLEFSNEFHSVIHAVDFWWIIFIIVLISCMICGWLVCHLLLPYSFSMTTWLPCHFKSFCWQVSWDLFPCTWWNFFHHSLFHYSFCNVPDILRVWCLSSRFPYCFLSSRFPYCFFSSKFPYCFSFTFWCRGLLFCILLTISGCVFAYWDTLRHTIRMIPLAHSRSLLQCLPRLSIGI